jgi:hypothetical protein
MDTERVVVAAGVIAVFTLLFTVVVPLGRALVKRLEARGAHSEGPDLEEIRARLQSLEARDARVAELEERVDFAERLLTREREAPPLGPGQRKDEGAGVSRVPRGE